MAQFRFLVSCAIFQLLLHNVDARSWCKPDQDCWPNHEVWRAFNESLHGKLLTPHPSAYYCHYPNYDSHLCNIATTNWTNAFWRADQVGSMQTVNWEAWSNETCLINSDPNLACSQGGVSAYAIDVAKAQDVQKSLKFAAKHNVRIVIKSTGHDFLGRSTARGSLMLWLHNLKGVEFKGSFIPEGCTGKEEGVAAVSVEAGVQWKQLYEEADENGVVVVGGQCSTVGATGGLLQGGGQSPLSIFYGLAADNVLQFKVVTPDGKLQTTNKCQNQDLFWALSGGGGGTFGIVLQATLRTFPPPQNVIFADYLVSSTNSSDIEDLTTHFNSITPQLADSGWTGTALIFLSSFTFQYQLFNSTLSAARSSLSPFTDYLRQHPHLNITKSSLTSYPSFHSWFQANECLLDPTTCTSVTGTNDVYASRLIPRSVFEENPATLSRIAMNALRNGTTYFYYFTAAGGNTLVPRNNSVNPAWRNALGILIFGLNFAQNTSATQIGSYIKKLSQINAPLRDLTPGSGTYLNQPDYAEPNWQQSLFGSHYPRLLEIKNKIDPSRMLNCHLCVGSEHDKEDTI